MKLKAITGLIVLAAMLMVGTSLEKIVGIILIDIS